MRVGIAIDTWKLSIFERHLSQSGYSFEQSKGLMEGTMVLYVETENHLALGIVVAAANTEAAKTGRSN